MTETSTPDELAARQTGFQEIRVTLHAGDAAGDTVRSVLAGVGDGGNHPWAIFSFQLLKFLAEAGFARLGHWYSVRHSLTFLRGDPGGDVQCAPGRT